MNAQPLGRPDYQPMPGRIVRLPEVRQLTGLSRSGLYKRMKEEAFPHAVGLGGRRGRIRGYCLDQPANFLTGQGFRRLISPNSVPDLGASLGAGWIPDRMGIRAGTIKSEAYRVQLNMWIKNFGMRVGIRVGIEEAKFLLN